MVEPSLAFLLENALTAIIIVLYLAYEIHWGRLNKLATQMDHVILAILALSRANPRVKEEAIAERLNGHSPESFLEEDDNAQD